MSKTLNKMGHLLLALIIIASFILPVCFNTTISEAASYTRQQTITITDTSGSSRSNLPVLINGLSDGTNISFLQTAGFIQTSGLDTAMQDTSSNDINYGLTTNTVPLLIPSLPALQSVTYTLLTEYSPVKTAFPILFGNNGYATILDHANLEMGNNFSVEGSGYIDTSSGSGKNIYYKQDAFVLDAGSTTAGNVSASIMSAPMAGSPSSQATDDTHIAIRNGATTRAGETKTGFTGRITSMQVNLKKSGSPTGNASLTVRNLATDALIGTLGTIDVATLTGTEAFYTFNTTPINVIGATDIRILVEYTGGDASNYLQLGYYAASGSGAWGDWTTYNGAYTDDANKMLTWQNLIWTGAYVKTVTETVATGVHSYKAYADATNFKLDIDGANVDSVALGGTSVPNNANNILVNQNNTMAYMTYLTLTVGGVELIEYRPDSILTATTTTYSTGTVTLTNGSTAVVGAGTTFTTAMVGGQIKGNNDGEYYTIASVTDTTHLALNANYTKTGGGSLAYTIQYSSAAVLPNEDNPGTYDATITWGYTSGLLITFGDLIGAPTIDTLTPVSISSNSATMQGAVRGMGDYTFAVCYFQYGTDTTYDAGTTSATEMTAIGGFFAVISDLLPNTIYHVRAVGVFGTYEVYGDDVLFMTTTFAGASTHLDIFNVAVVSGYYQTGDMLFIAETFCNYTSYYPSESARDSFVVQLLATDGTTVIGSSPLSNWGDRPTAIYFSAATVVAKSLVEGSAYTIRLEGTYVPTTPYVERILVASDWLGGDLTRLDDWIKGVATNMGEVDNENYFSGKTDVGFVLSDEGGSYFTDGITGIARIRPTIFLASQSKVDFVKGVPNSAFDSATTWDAQIGAIFAADATEFGNLFGLTGKTILAIIIFGIAILIVILVLVRTKENLSALGLIALVTPLLLVGAYFRIIPMQLIAVLAMGLVFMFIRQVFWKSM